MVVFIDMRRIGEQVQADLQTISEQVELVGNCLEKDRQIRQDIALRRAKKLSEQKQMLSELERKVQTLLDNTLDYAPFDEEDSIFQEGKEVAYSTVLKLIQEVRQ